jgi:hypothetical protein
LLLFFLEKEISDVQKDCAIAVRNIKSWLKAVSGKELN